MKILKDHLWPAVQFLSQIASKRATLPILNCFRLEAKNGTLSIRATDLDQDAVCLVECKDDLATCCVNAHHFSGLVASASDSISISSEKGMRMESGWVAKLPLTPEVEFPAPLFKSGKAHGVSTVDLADAMDSAVWAKSVDPSRYVLHGVHVTCSASKIECEATDSKVMARYDKAAIAAKCEFILHADFVRLFAPSLRKTGAALVIGENSVKVTHGEGEYSAKLLEGTFPSTNRLIGGDRASVGDMPLEEAREHVRQCIALAGEDWPKVSLEFSSKGCLVSLAHATRSTSYSGTVVGKYAPLKFETDATRLLKGLRSFNGSEKAAVHTSPDGVLIVSHGDYSMFISGLEKKAA